MLLCNLALRLHTQVVGETGGALACVNSHVSCDPPPPPQYFQIFPRANLSFDKLAYTGSDSCFGWLETQSTGIHFTVELVANVSSYAFHFPVSFSFFFFLADTFKGLLV